MAIALQIFVEGEPFDLLEGESERFYISKQIFDLRNLETRNAEFSKSIEFPVALNMSLHHLTYWKHRRSSG